jgi:nucleotide-binding universal stress UspA family protein
MPTNRKRSRAQVDRSPVALRRILLATDLTACCDRALDRAVMIARQHNAALRVLHVVDASLLTPRFVKEEVREGKARVDAYVREYRGDGFSIETAATPGDPAKAIVEEASAARADLIVMGMADYGAPSAAFRGTTIDRTVRSAPCPVLAVKARPRRGYDAIMFGSLIRSQIDDMVESGPRANLIVRRGVAYDVLLREVERLEPDLVVLGTHGRTGLSKVVLGSVAEALLARLRCDVLVSR